MPVLIGFLAYVALTVLLALLGQGIVAGILTFVGVIVIIIMFHEFGHFLTAKWSGMKVEEFFVGFGPRVWSRRRGETEYGMKAIPAGGYVRIAGMNPFQEPPEEDRPRTFGAKPAWKRAVVLIAGSFTHFVLAYLLLVVFFGAIGVPRFYPRIEVVEQRFAGGVETPAARAGLEPGDQIVEVDGRPVRDYEDFVLYTREHVGEPITLGVERDGEVRRVTVEPVLTEIEGQRVGRIGVQLAPGEIIARNRESWPGALAEGGRALGRASFESFRALGRVFGPEGLERIGQLLIGNEERTLEDPVGVVGVSRLSGQAFEAGRFDDLIALFAGLNVFVGILNLLPLPPLDGGHLAVLGVEVVTGRRVDLRRLIPLTAVVAGFLILYTLSLLYIDVTNPIPNPFR